MIMMRRSDKRKDRVEISPEQLMLAAEHAEKLAKDLHRPMRVVGWYHSHPHITDQSLQVTCFQSVGDVPNCTRREVELHIVASSGDQKHFTQRVLELPKILFAEEKEQYEAYPQIKGTLPTVHNAAVFSSSLLHAMSVVEAPLLHGLRERAKVLSWRNRRIKEQIDRANEHLAPLETSLADLMRDRQVTNGNDCCR
ncbi:hypothetical protein B566_EDAN008889 [Ephemera danica]|nr:hypothetical protein B566_EDAN008889 [Ephemera danica]